MDPVKHGFVFYSDGGEESVAVVKLLSETGIPLRVETGYTGSKRQFDGILFIDGTAIVGLGEIKKLCTEGLVKVHRG